MLRNDIVYLHVEHMLSSSCFSTEVSWSCQIEAY